MISHMWKFCKLSCNYCNNTNQENDENTAKPLIDIDESSEEDKFSNTGLRHRLGRSNPIEIEKSSMENSFDENESDLKVVEQDQESNENFDQNDEVICEDKDKHCVKWANENRCDEKGKSIYKLVSYVIQLDYGNFSCCVFK